MAPLSVNLEALLKDRYQIIRELSRGGFGRVFHARDQQLHDRSVVIKIKLDHAHQVLAAWAEHSVRVDEEFLMTLY